MKLSTLHTRRFAVAFAAMALTSSAASADSMDDIGERPAPRTEPARVEVKVEETPAAPAPAKTVETVETEVRTTKTEVVEAPKPQTTPTPVTASPEPAVSMSASVEPTATASDSTSTRHGRWIQGDADINDDKPHLMIKRASKPQLSDDNNSLQGR